MSASTPLLDAPATNSEPPDERPPPQWWGRLEVWIGLLIVAACVAFIFVQLEPRLLLRNTTPAGGDTGAHVWWPAYLRDHLLPWRLAGWSPDYFAGFPAGQFYFPLPALLILALNIVLPYNVAFKLITALGPLLLPVGAYTLARGLRAKNPAPAALAVAATGFLFFNGDPGSSAFDRGTVSFDQHIMGGNLASNLAGEFSYTLALALALCFLGVLAWSLRTKRSLWLPAVLLAATAMSHLVVAVFAVVGAVVIVLGTRPRARNDLPGPTGVLAGVGGVVLVAALAVAGASGIVVAGAVVVVVVVAMLALWPLPTIGRAVAIGAVGALLTAVWSVPLVATLQYTTDMRYAAITQYSSYLFPWSYLFGVQGALPWQWGGAALITIAIIGGIVGRRPSTFVLVTLTAVTGLLFRVWASIQATPAWNLRVLPFWYLCVFLLMGLGVAELVLGAAWLARRGAAWLDTHRDRWDDDSADLPGTSRRWAASTPRLFAIGTAVSLTVLLAIGALVNIDRGKGFLPYWIKWNESGYQDTRGAGGAPKKAYSEYQRLINTVSALSPGRVMWEGGSALNNYGTPLALMLLPYWTNDRFPSMEGLYYESSATTPYVFMTVATVDAPGNASNPVRGVPYRTFSDFSLGVRYLQLMGVRYFIAHSAGSRQAAAGDSRLHLVATSATGAGGITPDTWSIYEVSSAPTVAPLAYQPVVVDSLSNTEQTSCKAQVEQNGIKASDITLHVWQDCIGVPWFNDPTAIDRPLVASGPSSWQHAQPTAARLLAKRPLPAVTVSDIRQTPAGVSFHVSRTGVPVVVKTSYFPNWQAHGATGVYRATPNFMVVVPTAKNVSVTYGTTSAEWLGRILTLFGLAALGALVWLGRRTRRARPVG
jgi:hypothetical protein